MTSITKYGAADGNKISAAGNSFYIESIPNTGLAAGWPSTATTVIVNDDKFAGTNIVLHQGFILTVINSSNRSIVTQIELRADNPSAVSNALLTLSPDNICILTSSKRIQSNSTLDNTMKNYFGSSEWFNAEYYQNRECYYSGVIHGTLGVLREEISITSNNILGVAVTADSIESIANLGFGLPLLTDTNPIFTGSTAKFNNLILNATGRIKTGISTGYVELRMKQTGFVMTTERFNFTEKLIGRYEDVGGIVEVPDGIDTIELVTHNIDLVGAIAKKCGNGNTSPNFSISKYGICNKDVVQNNIPASLVDDMSSYDSCYKGINLINPSKADPVLAGIAPGGNIEFDATNKISVSDPTITPSRPIFKFNGTNQYITFPEWEIRDGDTFLFRFFVDEHKNFNTLVDSTRHPDNDEIWVNASGNINVRFNGQPAVVLGPIVPNKEYSLRVRFNINGITTTFENETVPHIRTMNYPRYLNGFGGAHTSNSKLKGSIYGVRIYSKIENRTYLINDGWLINPQIKCTVSNQHATAHNFVESGWVQYQSTVTNSPLYVCAWIKGVGELKVSSTDDIQNAGDVTDNGNIYTISKTEVTPHWQLIEGFIFPPEYTQPEVDEYLLHFKKNSLEDSNIIGKTPGTAYFGIRLSNITQDLKISVINNSGTSISVYGVIVARSTSMGVNGNILSLVNL